MPARVTINYVYLLIGLLLLTLVKPMADQFLDGELVHKLSDYTGLILLVGVWSLASSRTSFRIGLVLAIFAVGLTAASIALGLTGLLELGRLLILLFCVLTAWIALRDVFRPNALVTVNHLTGAVCIYLLIAVIFAIAYQLVESLSPGSFKIGVEGVDLDSTFLYFSFVTMTTIGYGDISPVKPGAMALAYMEAVVGQVYLTVLVAGLVGIHVSARAPASQS